eukprot:4819214-Prymnesium_polylepis.1
MANAASSDEAYTETLRRMLDDTAASMENLRKRAAAHQPAAADSVANAWRTALSCTGCGRTRPVVQHDEQPPMRLFTRGTPTKTPDAEAASVDGEPFLDEARARLDEVQEADHMDEMAPLTAALRALQRTTALIDTSDTATVATAAAEQDP